MAITATSSQGVKFIKIPRIDASGNDNTLSLQELTSLRISTSDQGVIQYDVLSISEYSDYYLYQVNTKNVTSSADNYIKDYRLAAYTVSQPLTSSLDGYQYLTASISPTGSNPLGYFNTASGVFTFGTTPNTDLSFSASFTVYNGSGVAQPVASFIKIQGGYLSITGEASELANGSTYTYKVSGSLAGSSAQIVEGDTLYPLLVVTGGSPSGVKFSGSFAINQVSGPNKNNNLNHNVSASYNGTTGYSYTSKPTLILTGSWTSVSNNTTNLFNASTGFYLVGNNNQELSNSVYITVVNGAASTESNVTLSLRKIDVLGNITTLTSDGPYNITSGASKDFTINAYSTSGLKTGDRLFLYLIMDAGAKYDVKTMTGKDFAWEIKSTAATSNTTSNLSVIEPYLVGNFINSDCDVTMNNALEIDYNQFYMDVDYGNNASSPINFSQIIAGTATRATVKSHNYTYQRVTRPRYEGSKLQALKLNTYTSASTITQKNADISNTELYGGDTSFGKDPVINLQKTYAARFQYIAGCSPDRYNTLFAYITDIVDEDGNVSQVRIDDPSYYNLINSFTDNERCNIKFISSQNSVIFSSVNGLKNIVKGGKRIEPIIYTSSGSGETGSFSQIVFLDNPNSPITSSTDFTFKTGKTANTTITTTPTTITTYDNLLKSNSRWSNTTGFYTFQTTDTKASPFRLNLNIDIISPQDTILPVNIVGLKLQKSASYTNNNWVDVQTFNLEFQTGTTSSYQLQTGFSTNINPGGYLIPSASDVYRFQIYRNLGIGTYTCVIKSLELQQQYLSGSGLAFSSDNYFITNSANLGVITASLSMSAFYNFYQQDVTNSGFNSITNPFKIEVGDEIRFENDESKTYFIYKVEEPGSQQDGRLKLYIQPSLQQNINANSVLIRRYVKDPNYILFEGVKASGGTPGGLIHPEFITEKMKMTLESNKLFTLDPGSSNTSNS